MSKSQCATGSGLSCVNGICDCKTGYTWSSNTCPGSQSSSQGNTTKTAATTTTTAAVSPKYTPANFSQIATGKRCTSTCNLTNSYSPFTIAYQVTRSNQTGNIYLSTRDMVYFHSPQLACLKYLACSYPSYCNYILAVGSKLLINIRRSWQLNIYDLNLNIVTTPNSSCYYGNIPCFGTLGDMFYDRIGNRIYVTYTSNGIQVFDSTMSTWYYILYYTGLNLVSGSVSNSMSFLSNSRNLDQVNMTAKIKVSGFASGCGVSSSTVQGIVYTSDGYVYYTCMNDATSNVKMYSIATGTTLTFTAQAPNNR